MLELIRKVKNLDFLVKLDTNGFNPKLLKKVSEQKLVDYIAMDVKAPLEKYPQVINVKIDVNKVAESIKLIMNSGIDYEFRTTIVKSQLNKEDILKIGILIKGAKRYALQKFLPTKVLDPEFTRRETYSDAEFAEFRQALSADVEECLVR